MNPDYEEAYDHGYEDGRKAALEEHGAIYGPGRPMEEAKDKGWVLCELEEDPLPVIAGWAKGFWVNRDGSVAANPVRWWPLPEPQKEGE